LQDEDAALPAREEPGQKRGARAADVEIPGCVRRGARARPTKSILWLTNRALAQNDKETSRANRMAQSLSNCQRDGLTLRDDQSTCWQCAIAFATRRPNRINREISSRFDNNCASRERLLC
jgi:hypothetical protein